MWDDVVIGDCSWGNTAILVRDLDTSSRRCHISQNQVSYWISGASYLDVGVRISKTTKEGEQLTKLIEAKASNEMLHQFLEDVVMEYIAPEIIKEKFNAAIDDAYARGSEHQAQLMRDALLL